MRTVGRLVLASSLACAGALLPATAAAAAAPERSGWWNRASAGTVVLPQPVVQPGDLRIGAVAPDQPAAYSAVLFTAPGATNATLDLEIRSAEGTPDVVACPTAEVEWPAGDNQAYELAPAYDCAVGLVFGAVSDDGTTLSFVLDSTTQTAPGVWSLALVPQPASTSGPFTLDLVEPGPDVFQAEAPEAPPAPDLTTEAPTSSGGGSGEAFLPEAFAAPPAFDTGTAAAPLVAEGTQVPLPATEAGVAPAVAAPAAGTPLLVATPAGVVEDLGSGQRLLALLVLAGGSAAVGYAAGQQRPGPRLIGGRARAGVPSAVPALAVDGPVDDRPRGIGRFAKARDAAPRRLR